MVELLQLLVLISKIESKGYTLDEVIQSMLSLSEAQQYLLNLQIWREDWISKRIHGWVDSKGRIRYPE